ncbi:MAG: chlorophyll synthase ChlG [Gemmatimonadota bacterium]|nr:chlorophyll synthase ChlG [Gemmatimonadota bacterium]MDQ8166661.1 chlorophyll synthase ChlG [Gemmatimonadota bacterium]MDQ8171950.1 chlorophyll synthase ChlG [Gemmatimonadota bacterium]
MSVSFSVRSAAVRPDPRAILTLLKPVTWFPPMWAYTCGAISAGVPLTERLPLLALGIAITGPLVCASSQAVNDWFDRHVDAINEPDRPIPSGRIPGQWGLAIALFWTALCVVAALPLGAFGVAAVAVALLFSWGYSAPPFRFKRNGWIGNAAVGFTYEGLAWVTGAGIMLGNRVPPMPLVVLAVLYSIGAHGIMTLNDFKAMDGDRRMGIRSLPVQLGADGAARVASLVMLLAQAAVIVLLVSWQRTMPAMAIAVLTLVQAVMMWRFMQAPRERALWLSALGVPFYVGGMMIAAFAVRSLPVVVGAAP